MDLRHLRYFITVAEELNFTRAAQRLHMAQPPLSQQIAQFEQELGLTLFDRSTRKVALSAVGADLLTEARAILESVDLFLAGVESRRRGERGQLRLSVISGLANSELAELLRDFRGTYPGISVSLEVHPSVWQLKAFRDSALDAGFLSRPEAELSGLGSVRILEGPMVLAVPREHPLCARAQLSWQDLNSEPMIWIEAASTAGDYYAEMRLRCREAGFEPLVTQYAPNGATQIWMVSAGLGVAPIHVTPKRADWPGVVFLSLPDNAPRHEIRFAWKATSLSPALGHFIDFVKARLEG